MLPRMKWVLRQILLTWRIWYLKVANETLTSRLAELKKKVVTSGNSVWNMNKRQLMVTARLELGVELEKAATETVTTLRERIRQHRLQVMESEDPLARLHRTSCLVPQGNRDQDLED